MKTRTRLLCLSLTLLCTIFVTREVQSQQLGDGAFQNSSVQPFMADLNVGWPGRFWAEVNLADRGLGYQGPYGTIGGKSHLFQDFLDGRWLVEAQGHVSFENGGFFGNLGVERVFSLSAAAADVSLGVWGDYDSDQATNFSHSMTAIGVSGSIKKQRWDAYGNGYFPVGTTDHTQGDPSGVNCFLNNSIIVQAGIDSALQGFDALLNLRPESLSLVRGTFGLGGYGYGSDLVDYFGGVRVQFGMQVLSGMIMNVQLNHDNRFDVTGVLQFAWQFGGNARGTEYGLLGRDLEPTSRNDHIVRFTQNLVLAIDPDTGRPYDVYHVDNTADAAFATGTVETPFTTLAEAEAAASTDDIIFVREGDGTTRGMREGIVLKDGQLLLGDGVRHVIPLADGTNFVLCNDLDGNLPRITNTQGGSAVTLANRNTLRGFIIDGSEGGMINGISGDGFFRGSPLFEGVIEDVTITGSPILNGIFLNELSGNWTFARNDIQTAFLDGIFIDNACDPTSVFTFDSNVVSNNGRDGIHMEDYDGTTFNFVNNITDGNGRDGIRLERFKNGSGLGASFDFINPLANANAGDGIAMFGADGNLRILNAQMTNSGANGVRLVDFTNTDPTTTTFIGTSGGGTSNFTGNGLAGGAGINIEQNVGVQRATITNSTLSGNGFGLLARSDGVGAFLTTNVIDNLAVSNNVTDGMRFIATGGSAHFATVENTADSLTMTNNGTAAGNGLSFITGDVSGTTSLLQGTVRNVNMTTVGGHGVFGDIVDDGQLLLTVENITITGTALDGFHFDANTNPTSVVNRVLIDNATVTTVGGDGVEVNTGIDTFFDFVLTGSSFTNAGAGGAGLTFTATGDDTLAAVDNRTRIFLENLAVTGFLLDGVSITGNGDAHVLATIDGVNSNGNGASTGAAPFFDGFDLTANDSSVFNVAFTNNLATGNFEKGLDVNVTGTSTMNLSMIGNAFSTNGAGGVVPLEDVNIANAISSSICLSMSNNSWTLPAVLTNASGATSFVLELDGATNQPAALLTLPAAFTPAAFGTVCAPAIAAEAAAFSAAGFPPLP